MTDITTVNVTMLDDEDADELLGRLDELIDEREELDKQITRLTAALEATRCSRRAVAMAIGSIRRIFGTPLDEARARVEDKAERFLASYKGMDEQA